MAIWMLKKNVVNVKKKKKKKNGSVACRLHSTTAGIELIYLKSFYQENIYL